jgi:hypothetical protein
MDEFDTSYEETAMHCVKVDYTGVEIADANEELLRVAVKSEKISDNVTIVKTGIVLWNEAEGVPSGELTLENAKNYNDIRAGGRSNGATEYSAKIKDNGSGIKAVGYVTFTDGKNTFTKYADAPVETTFEEEAMKYITINYKPLEIASVDEKLVRIAITSSSSSEDATIIRSGLVLWNRPASEPFVADLTLENAEKYAGIYTGNRARATYSAKIKDNGAGMYAVGFTTFTIGSKTFTKYADSTIETTFDKAYEAINGTRV